MKSGKVLMQMGRELISEDQAFAVVASILESIEDDVTEKDMEGIPPGLVLIVVDEDGNLSTHGIPIAVKSIEELYPAMEGVMIGYAKSKTMVVMFVFCAISDLEALTIDGKKEMLFGALIRAMTIDGRSLWGFRPLRREGNLLRVKEDSPPFIHQDNLEEIGSNIMTTLATSYAAHYFSAVNSGRKEFLN